jgi:hypothetical protein
MKEATRAVSDKSQYNQANGGDYYFPGRGTHELASLLAAGPSVKATPMTICEIVLNQREGRGRALAWREKLERGKRSA